MPNRQRGKTGRPAAGFRPADSRSPEGGRSPAGGRNARTVPVRAPGTPSYTEPEMRRWPHPLEDPAPSPAPEPAMHYIRCALSYQNQLLADIKALLEQLAADRAAGPSPAGETANPEENLSKL